MNWARGALRWPRLALHEFVLLADALGSGMRWYRRARGGKWEHQSACCACPVDTWSRVTLFMPQAERRRRWLPGGILDREDYR